MGKRKYERKTLSKEKGIEREKEVETLDPAF